MLIVLAIALILRVVAMSLWSSDLSVDRDAYVGLAQSLVEGRGFSGGSSTVATAFRPPLYPMLLATFLWMGVPAAVASVNMLASLFAVWGTLKVAELAKLGRISWLPGLLVAVDPLLIKYSSQPMTEVVSTALLIWWVYAFLLWHHRGSWRASVGCGVLFGLNVLCRPTFLAAGPLLVIWVLVQWRRQGRIALRETLVAGLSAVVILAPWSIRNLVMLGKLTLATTHGGYTLLLANNDSFYRSSVEGENFGRIWERLSDDDPDSQASWYGRLNDQMNSQGLKSETERDQYEYQLAFEAIRKQPMTFLKACALRMMWFWHVVPQGPEAGSMSRVILWGIGSFYVVENLLALAGVFVLMRRSVDQAVILLIPVVTLVGVHLFFWTNLRMRAPLLPVLALLAGVAIFAWAKRKDEPV